MHTANNNCYYRAINIEMEREARVKVGLEEGT